MRPMSEQTLLTQAAAPGPSFSFEASQRYPDPRIEVLHPSFAKYRIFSSSVEMLGSGMRWAEGPVWFGDGRYLLVSDIPGNRILRYDEATGAWGVFRQPSNMANGLARDMQGRLLACEHGGRRITRTEYDGSITVLADRFEGKRLNSPNDIVCQSNGAIWFTDPPFGIGGHWEGEKAEPELPHAVYRIDPVSGQLQQVLTDLAGPNGLAFAPGEQVLYIVESRAQPHRKVWAYDVDASGRFSGKRLVIDAQGAGALDGYPALQAGLSFMLPALFLSLLLSILSRPQVPVIAVAGLATVVGTLAISPTSGILAGMLAGAVAGTLGVGRRVAA